MAPHPLRRHIRHRHLGRDTRTRPSRSLPTLGHGPRPLHRGSSKPGWPPSPIRGASALRSSRWMDSPGLRAQPLKNSPARGRSWIPSMSCALPVMLSMSAADAFSKNFTIGAGVPRIPCTRPAGCYTPDLACSRHASSTNYSTCFPVRSTSRSRSRGASTRTSPGAYRDPNKIRGKALMQAEINTLTSTHVPSCPSVRERLDRAEPDLHACTEGSDRAHDAGQDAQTPSRGRPRLLRPPPHQQRSYRSHQRPPRTPTRNRPRACETSPTTSPEHSSKPEDSDPNYTLNYEEPVKLWATIWTVELMR